MKEIFSTVAFELSSGERAAIRVLRGEALKVSGERLWITRSNDEVDYFLYDGDVLALRPNETLWLSVDGPRDARLTFTFAEGPGRRLANWFGRLGNGGTVGTAGRPKLGLRAG